MTQHTSKLTITLLLFSMYFLTAQSAASQSPDVVHIGSQTWMTENLDVDHFRNGDPIPQAKTIEDWQNAYENQEPAWGYYENDPANGEKYGKLYNRYAVEDARGLAPEGWHIPSMTEWDIFDQILDIGPFSSGSLRDSAWWNDGSNGGKAGTSRFEDKGRFGYWWSTSEFRDRGLSSYTNNPRGLVSYSYGTSEGKSVRLVKDYSIEDYAQRDGAVQTSSGLLYRVIEEGSGGNPSPNSTVHVVYTGFLADGTVFDSSDRSDDPATFSLEQVIPGLAEGIQLMRGAEGMQLLGGSIYEFFIPAELAFGDHGGIGNSPIKPGSDLLFYIELVRFSTPR
ncbi:MAG: FKBP-type peptidyl-prolyl cis-trans isomerase [Opitutales bacterium]|nr:FKBP-type peptidyl-prolyl cis-trans isomerase [Opitutales bacterium]